MDNESKSGLTLWTGIVQLNSGDWKGAFPCRVSFDLNRGNTLDFAVGGSLSGLMGTFFSSAPIFVTFPGVKDEVECYVRSSRLGGQAGEDSAVLCPRFSIVHVESGSQMRRVVAGLVNLAPYLFVGPGQSNSCTLNAEGWEIQIAPIPAVFEFPAEIQGEPYHFTHLLQLSRSDEQQFSASDARSRLEDVSRFLSFCSGRWISTALAYGIGSDGELAYQEWGTGQVSVNGSTDSCLDLHHGGEMVGFFPTFTRLLRSHEQTEMVRFVLYWYIRANSDFVGPDGGCILLQTALERIAWQVLVNDRHALSRKGFGDLCAADQLRLVFNYLSIPLDVPPELDELVKLAKGRGLDGPEVLTFIRNRIVHPPKEQNTVQRYPYYQAYTLAK
jgi:hypothetical protein